MTNAYGNHYWDIEVSPKMHDIISEMFSLLGLTAPSSITHAEMEKISQQMKVLFNAQARNLCQSKYKIFENKLKPQVKVKLAEKINKALVISNLGIIRYQLKNLLQHKKIDTITSESLYTGLAEYVKKLHDVVIIDVSNNYEEALEVIDEIKRIARANSIKTKIVVIAPQLKNNEKLRFITRGVDKFIEKQLSWYYEFEEYFQGLLETSFVRL